MQFFAPRSHLGDQKAIENITGKILDIEFIRQDRQKL